MIKPEPTEWVLPLYSRNGKHRYGELRVHVNLLTVLAKREEIGKRCLINDEELRVRLEKFECCKEIDTLKNDNITKEKVLELQAAVDEQVTKLPQVKGNKEDDMFGLEEECEVPIERKQSKISDLEKCKMNLDELERKYREMLEVKKECEITVEQKKQKVAELREEYERKIHELQQRKLFSALKQHNEKKIEENYQKIVRELLEDVTKIQQLTRMQKVVR